MTRTGRLVLFATAAGALGAAVLLAVVQLPAFGHAWHPYRTMAVHAAVRHATANVVSSVNFDTRAFDTLGEECIFFASVVGVSVLLRPAQDEELEPQLTSGRVLPSTRLAGYVLLPVTVLLGLDLVAHGHLTPGGGFQGGVVVGTGIHFLYVAGRYRALRRLGPPRPFELGEAFGTGVYACLAVTGIVVAGAFLANMVPTGSFGHLLSAGTVPVLNGAVGIEVASGVVVLLSRFLQQVAVVRQSS